MSYAYYILAVLVIGFACMCVIRYATRSRNRAGLGNYPERHAGDATARGGLKTKTVTARELRHVATPWGWPNHAASRAGLSDSLHGFADKLIRSKSVADPADASLRHSDNIRALLEDRYGRVRREPTPEVPYRGVKRPLLRDPGEPHDQMDNLGTAEAERIRRKLHYLKAMQGEARSAESKPAVRYVELKDIKQPWGW